MHFSGKRAFAEHQKIDCTAPQFAWDYWRNLAIESGVRRCRYCIERQAVGEDEYCDECRELIKATGMYNEITGIITDDDDTVF